MLPQNYNVAFKKQLGKVYNFKFGIGVTTKMQIKATVSGGLGSGGQESRKHSFRREALWNAFLAAGDSFLPTAVGVSPWGAPAEGGARDAQ